MPANGVGVSSRNWCDVEGCGGHNGPHCTFDVASITSGRILLQIHVCMKHAKVLNLLRLSPIRLARWGYSGTDVLMPQDILIGIEGWQDWEKDVVIKDHVAYVR
jgi:hypothetical protein